MAGSERHTYVVFGDGNLGDALSAGLRDLDADLKTLSDENLEDMAGIPHVSPTDEDLDVQGAIRRWIAANAVVRPVDADVARAALPDRAIVQTFGFDARAAAAIDVATHAVEIGANVAALLHPCAPFALVAMASAGAKRGGYVVYDTIGTRVLPQTLVDDPLASVELKSVGTHVRVIAAPKATNAIDYTTIGLEKYGLFDLELRDMPQNLDNAGDVVAAFAQSLVTYRPAKPGSWTPGSLYVTSNDLTFFYDNDTPYQSEARNVTFRCAPETDGAVSWAISPHDPKSIADALQELRSANPKPRSDS